MFTEQQKPLQKWETYLVLLFVAATGYLYFFAPGPRTDNDASSGFLVYGGIGLLIFAGLSFIKWRQDSGIQGRSRLVFLHRSACIGLYVVTFLSICAVLFLLIMGGRAGEGAETTNYLWIISFPFLGICGGYMIGFFIGIVIEVCRLFMGNATVAAEAPSTETQPPPLPTDSTTSNAFSPSSPPVLPASEQSSSDELPPQDKSFAEENPWEAMKHNVMQFLRWLLPILKKGGEKAVEAAKKGGEVAVEATKKAAPHVKAQLDKIPVEAMKEQALQQVDKVPGGRGRFVVIAGALLLVLVSGWWMMLPNASAQKEIDDFCMRLGTDVMAKDSDGLTLLHKAAKFEGVDVVKFLIKNGADINAVSDAGATPLHCSAGNDKVEVIKYLVSKGATVQTRSTSGETPLHEAAWEGNLDTVKFLIKKGAEVHARCKDGKTPLDFARTRNNDEIVKYITAKYGEPPVSNKIDNRQDKTDTKIAQDSHRQKEIGEYKEPPPRIVYVQVPAPQPTARQCSSCKGTGRSGSCSTCWGRGELWKGNHRGFGDSITCTGCSGTGKLLCRQCNGRGTMP